MPPTSSMLGFLLFTCYSLHVMADIFYNNILTTVATSLSNIFFNSLTSDRKQERNIIQSHTKDLYIEVNLMAAIYHCINKTHLFITNVFTNIKHLHSL